MPLTNEIDQFGIPESDVAKADKKIDVTRLYRDIGDFYKNNPDRREEIASAFLDLAGRLGVTPRFIDNRDMFLVADKDNQLVTSVGSFKDAQKIVDQNPGYKYWNRTHPACPKEVRDQFDKKTGWA